jgi:hypothetical protein
MKLTEIKIKLTELNIPFKSTLKKAELELLLPKEEEEVQVLVSKKLIGSVVKMK